MADLAKRRGHCTNFGNGCAVADSKKIVEVDITDDFVCPECGSDLTEIVKKPFPKWIIAVIAAVVLLGGGAGVWAMLSGDAEPAAEPEPVADLVITLSQSDVQLEVGQTATLTVATEPAEAAGDAIEWQSDDDAVATVENGTITAVGEGEATVTAMSSDGEASAEARVTVTPAAVETPVAKPVAPATPASARFTGTIRSGYPHGTGTLTFLRSRRIDLHDEKARTAAAGEYIIGEWDNGHLVQGRWYDASNNLKETIVLGKAMNPEKDHALGRCSK